MGTLICGSSSRGSVAVASRPSRIDAKIVSGVSFECRNVSAMRLKGLGASFHAETLIDLAEEALDSAPGDPAILRKLRAFLASFPDA